jgi:hypothetical protein
MLGRKASASTSRPREKDSCRHEGSRAGRDSCSTASAEAQAGWPSRKRFIQTHYYGQSVAKLVWAPQLQRNHRQDD